MTTQLDLFNEAKVEIGKPEPMTEVRLGHPLPGSRYVSSVRQPWPS